MSTAISTEELSKSYRIGELHSAYGTLRDTFSAAARRFVRGERGSHYEEIWALRDVSFDVPEGQVLGVIGKNGAGKSTLLKILTRITTPTSGRVEIRGRVGSLLEVGTGFHPELTGRENVFLNGSVLGMKRQEIQRKFDEIVEFSGVERFLDTPVKRYSSGMFVRLAFAVAAHLEPEILIVDEVLAVGDSAFQKKCLGKMHDVAGEGRTVLFVSHNMTAVMSLCTRCIYLAGGRLQQQGTTDEIIGRYMREVGAVSSLQLGERSDRQGNGSLRFLSFDMRDTDGTPVASACTGQDVLLSFRYAGTAPLNNVQVSIGVHGRMDESLFYLSTEICGDDFGAIPSEGVITCRLPRLSLLPGSYSFNLFCTVGGEIADWVQNAGVIEVASGDFFGSGKLPPVDQGAMVVPHEWLVEEGMAVAANARS
jgi:lipopolysaccharide transport system ATP-binding protein